MDRAHAERGQQWLATVLQLAGFAADVAVVSAQPFAEDSDWLLIDEQVLSPDQIEILIGSGGEVLDSIQYLANTTLNLGLEADNQGAYTIELAGYRVRRYEELKVMAEQAAEQVRETGKEVELKSLSSAERRQVHTLLKPQVDLETTSRGQEPNRRLVISLLPTAE